MLKNINFKHSLIFFISSFLYLDIIIFVVATSIGKLYFENFNGIDFTLVTIIVFFITVILSLIYALNEYDFNQIIFRLRVILVLFPIIVIGLGTVISTSLKVGINNYNKRINKIFDGYQEYIDLSNYYKDLEFRFDPKTNELIKTKNNEKKISFVKYKPLTYSSINFNKTTKYNVYELNGAYLFSVIDNEKKNFIVKRLDKDLYFYQVNINPARLKKEVKYFELIIIDNPQDYDQMNIDDNEYLSGQNAQEYNIYKHYFEDFYVLYKKYSIKPYLIKKFPNYNSVSYTNKYTNVTIDNEVHKVYAKIDEDFKLILYENINE